LLATSEAIDIAMDITLHNIANRKTTGFRKQGVHIQVGRIELARFNNPSGLEAVGPKLFVETPASGQPVVACPGENGVGTILSGYLEGSNVNILEELIQLRTLQSWEKGVYQALMTIHEGGKQITWQPERRTEHPLSNLLHF
jgi:flagellar hook protein FlgE